MAQKEWPGDPRTDKAGVKVGVDDFQYMQTFAETRVTHLNSRYKVQFERSAVKGQDGFRVEANDDILDLAMQYADILYKYAQDRTKVEIKQEVKSA